MQLRVRAQSMPGTPQGTAASEGHTAGTPLSAHSPQRALTQFTAQAALRGHEPAPNGRSVPTLRAGGEGGGGGEKQQEPETLRKPASPTVSHLVD